MDHYTQVEQTVKEILAKQLKIDTAKIKPDVLLAEDLRMNWKTSSVSRFQTTCSTMSKPSKISSTILRNKLKINRAHNHYEMFFKIKRLVR